MREKYYCYLHFTEEVTEAKSELVALGHSISSYSVRKRKATLDISEGMLLPLF